MIRVILRESVLASGPGIAVLLAAIVMSQMIQTSGLNLNLGSGQGLPAAIAASAGLSMLALRHSFKLSVITSIISGFTMIALFV